MRPENYRPIASVPMLYKLFFKLLCNRLGDKLDDQQGADQAGFRPKRGTTDHLFTATILHEITDEGQVPLWISAVDLKKAFDCVTHASTWESLREQQVPTPYIH